MNIRCPDCHTLFRLDAREIPAGGVDARCSRCGTVFPLGRPQSAVSASPSSAAVAADAMDEDHISGTRTASVAADASGESKKSATPAATVSAESTSGAAYSEGAPAASGSPLSPNEDARARRFARALVSDIVAYHPNLIAEASDPAAIQETFREEIMKSWQEYVEQVGRDTAEGTPYFRDALNDLLAEGRKVF